MTDNGAYVVAVFHNEMIEISYQEAPVEEEGSSEPDAFPSMTHFGLEEEQMTEADSDVDSDVQDYLVKDFEFSAQFPKRMSRVCHDIELVLRATVDKHL